MDEFKLSYNLRRLERVFTLRGDWFRVNAIPITMLREIERTGNERQVYYQFILKICSVTYVEIFHASSIQLYLTFKTFLKKSVVCNFFKS